MDDPGAGSASAGRRDALRLSLLFGTIYFVQGIGEPTEGLIIQPVRSLLASWHYEPHHIAAFAALLAVPWSLKPLFGLLTDFVPLFGYRRKSYLIATSALAATSLLVLAVAPIPAGAARLLFAGLLLPTLAVACADVVADALMVDEGQPRGLTGRLQAVQWACMYAATIVSGSLSGFLTERKQERLAFALCGGLSVVTLVLSCVAVREPRRTVALARGTLGSALRELVKLACTPTVASVAAFLFLWNFNPFSTTVLHLHMTQAMGFSEQFYGHTVSLLAVASVAACVAYGAYCRRVPMPLLVRGSIVLGIVATLGYWLMSDRTSAVLVALGVGFTYMTATLIQLDLAARTCPPRVAGTVFALLMAASNAGLIASTWLGGLWYDQWSAHWGRGVAFHVLIGVGAAFTASCWLLVPFLPRVDAQAGAHV